MTEFAFSFGEEIAKRIGSIDTQLKTYGSTEAVSHTVEWSPFLNWIFSSNMGKHLISLLIEVIHFYTTETN